MSVFPRTSGGWARVAVLPLQVYVATGWIAFQFYIRSAGLRHGPDVYGPAFCSYAFCCLALCAGAMLQRKCGDRMGMYFSFIMALFAFCQLPNFMPHLD